MEIMETFKERVNDLKWFKLKYKDIQKHYPGKYIAVKDRIIIDDDKDYFRLLEKLKKIGLDTSKVLIKKVPNVNEFMIYYA